MYLLVESAALVNEPQFCLQVVCLAERDRGVVNFHCVFFIIFSPPVRCKDSSRIASEYLVPSQLFSSLVPDHINIVYCNGSDIIHTLSRFVYLTACLMSSLGSLHLPLMEQVQ